MKMPIPRADDKNFATVIRMKKEITATVFTTTARVRDGMLRPTGDDEMEAVLEELNGMGEGAQPKDEPFEDIDIFS